MVLKVGLLSSPFHQWLEPTCTYFNPPPGLGAVPNANGKAVNPHRGGRISAFGLRRKACRSDVRGYAGRDRLPAGGVTLVDIQLRVRTANSDNGNHLSGVSH